MAINNPLTQTPHRARKAGDALSVLTARCDEVKAKAAECDTESLRDSITGACTSLMRAIALQQQSMLAYWRVERGDRGRVGRVAKASAEATIEERAKGRQYATARDRADAQAAEERRLVGAAAAELRSRVEGEFRPKADAVVQGAVDAIKNVQRELAKAELRAKRPLAMRVGDDAARQAMITNLRVDVAAMPLEDFAKLYLDCHATGDVEQCELYEAAARPWLQTILREGVAPLRRATPRASAIGDQLQIATALLNRFAREREGRLPAELHVARQCVGKLEELFKVVIGIDPSIGGGMSNADFQRRFMSGGNKPPAQFDPFDGWWTRWLIAGNFPRLTAWDSVAAVPFKQE